jgi:hypothetical protein
VDPSYVRQLDLHIGRQLWRTGDDALATRELERHVVGVIGQGSGGGRALRVTWTATQDGSTASGQASLLTSPPVTDAIFSGILVGKISGSQVSFTLSAQPLPGSDCALSGTGSAAVATVTLTGSLNVQFTSCGALEPPSNNQLVLAKQ